MLSKYPPKLPSPFKYDAHQVDGNQCLHGIVVEAVKFLYNLIKIRRRDVNFVKNRPIFAVFVDFLADITDSVAF